MCGRFENTVTGLSIFKRINAGGSKSEIRINGELKQFNIAPTNRIMILSKEEGKDKYILSDMKWGIKFGEKSPLIFNSRIETISEKKFWSMLFNRNRCLIPMTAFYEWKKCEDINEKKKTPYRIYLPEKDFFFVPGLYTFNKEKNDNEVSLVTTTPNIFMKDIHHRMPVIMQPEDAVSFFECDFDDNLKICKPYNDREEMVMEEAEL
jgi:putative SOS response-associated peptidase YedK